jgi:hypothetical protein
LITRVIKNILTQINIKIRKNLSLVKRDKIMMNEVSNTFLIILEQVNSFEFSNLDIINLHYFKKLKIKEALKMQKVTI